MPQIVAIYGGKGGIGKTTTATSFASLSGLDDVHTLLVDANADQPSAQVIHQTAERAGTAPPYDLAVERNPRVIAAVAYAGYQRVFIDCPPSPAEAAAALQSADFIVVPFVPRFLETRAITRTVQTTLAGFAFRVLFVAVTHAARSRAAAVREAFSGLNVPVFDAQVRAYTAHERVQARGVSLFGPEAPGLDVNAERAAGDYRAAYRELLRVIGERTR
jgi:chromosome partitioning protein